MFTHLHVHTQYSYLDGFGMEDSFAKTAKKMGFTHLGFTNHGNVDGVIKFQKACDKVGIVPIIGCELYLVGSLTTKEKPSHITVFVKNKRGWKNLCQMLHRANVKGFYRTARVDADYLLAHSKGLLFGTACQNSFLMKPYGKKIVEKLKKNLFIEVMPHRTEKEREKIKKGLKVAKRKGLKIIATNDCHYVKKGDQKIQDLLLAIQSRALVNDKSRFRFTVKGLFLRSEKEMKKAFERQGVLTKKQIRVALSNTKYVVGKCENFRLKKITPILPDVPSVKGDEDKFLKNKCMSGLKRKFKGEKVPQEYKERLNEEFDLIKKKGFVRYFLLVWDMLQWCRKNKIPFGPGRGSVGGSLMAFCLDITNLDPIKHGLIFSRFISMDRNDFPDIDLDFDKYKRDAVRKYLESVYGRDRVAGISTVMRMKSRAVIRDVARTHGFEKEVDAFAKQIDYRQEVADDMPLIRHVAKNTKEGVAFNRRHPEIVKAAIRLEGQIRGVGQHPAAVIISPEGSVARSGRGHFSLRKKVSVLNWDMSDSEYMGFVKLDLLSLDTVSVLYEGKNLIKQKNAKNIIFEDLPLDDPKVFKAYNKGETVGIFQAGTSATTNLLRKVDVQNFYDLAATFALVRPGPSDSGMTKDYVERKAGKRWEKKHKIYEEITKETFGIVVYQEQVMAVINKIAGLTLSEADKIRKVIGKKRDAKEFAPFKKKFIRGCKKQKTLSKAEAKEFWNALQKHARYSFNKSHSVAYAMLSYWMMWMKVNYPQEFLCALLTAGSKKEKNKTEYADEARRLGMRVLPAQVGKSSGEKWRIEGKDLRAPFCEVKNVGKKGNQVAALKIKGKGIKGFFSAEESVSCEKMPGKLGDMLADIGAYDGKPKVNLEDYYPFQLDIDTKVIYPNLYKMYGDKITSDKYARRLATTKRFPKQIVDIGMARDYEIYTRVLDCKRCRLRKSARKPVMPQKGKMELMISGEAPGTKEDDFGIGFLAKAGDLLWDTLESQGMQRKDFHVTNACKCYPGVKWKTPTEEEIHRCRPWLEEEINFARPKVILAFGNTNLISFLGIKKGITDYSGRIIWHDASKAWVCYCVHPSYGLRGGNHKRKFISGVKSFTSFVKSQNFKK